uniref:CSON002196 protein n=1 Tax=Culicoides sonorensis TaxID=179676 RepID=A0A336L1R1_CULSO
MSDSDNSNSDQEFSEAQESSSNEVKEEKPKRKRLADYLAEKAAREALEAENASDTDPDEVKVSLPAINPVNFIKNKDVRRQKFKRLQVAKKKEEKAERKMRKQQPGPKSRGHTIESLREVDQTTVNTMEAEEMEEIQKDLETDEFSEYFAKIYEPKVLITYSDNPHTKTRKFGKELNRIIPNSLAKVRNRSSLKKICKSAIREEFTDVIVINESRTVPDGLIVVHLPDGPTAHFKLSNVKLTKELRKNYKDINSHRPEVVLNNFSTRLGLRIGRMMGALFHHDPEFKGRRVATFHNQRDYIFFRHHRYEFGKNGERVKLHELGPRFTLKLRSLQSGLFDTKTGDYEWMITNKRHQMEGRRRFFL